MVEKLYSPQALIDRASLPYFPEMLDHTLAENLEAEEQQIRTYRDALQGSDLARQITLLQKVMDEDREILSDPRMADV